MFRPAEAKAWCVLNMDNSLALYASLQRFERSALHFCVSLGDSFSLGNERALNLMAKKTCRRRARKSKTPKALHSPNTVHRIAKTLKGRHMCIIYGWHGSSVSLYLGQPRKGFFMFLDFRTGIII